MLAALPDNLQGARDRALLVMGRNSGNVPVRQIRASAEPKRTERFVDITGGENQRRQAGEGITLEEHRKRLEFRNGCHQALAGQGVEILIDRVGRIRKPSPDFLHRAAKRPLRQIEMIAKKFVGVLDVDPVTCKHPVRKVFEILRHYDIAAADDRRRENMTVIRIGERKRRNQGLIAADQAVTRCLVH